MQELLILRNHLIKLSRMERLNFLFEKAQQAPYFDEQWKSDEYLVHGCLAKLWVKPVDKNYYVVDSESKQMKGLVWCALEMLSFGVELEKVREVFEEMGIMPASKRNAFNNLLTHLSKTKGS